MTTTTNSSSGRVDPATLNWKNLGFSYVKTNGHVRYTWRDGKWDNGVFNKDFDITLDIAATVLHYGQSCFEGLKAFRMKDGKIRVFRPEVNARRMQKSCRAICMAEPPIDLFLEAVRRAVAANVDYVPPYGSNGALYIRPFVFGSGANVGLSPATEYTFMVLVTPVGEYYAGGMGSPTKALIKHKFDRAATYGTGTVKCGGNYAPSLAPTIEAKKKGYTVMLFLDAKENKYVEEFATSNFAALTAPDANGKRVYVTPKSGSVLASVTNRSLCELASRRFGWEVERRLLSWDEVKSGNKFTEVAACGTAVVITPVAEIHREIGTPKQKQHSSTVPTASADDPFGFDHIDDDAENDDISLEVAKIAEPNAKFEGFTQLYDAYRALQYGELEGWEDYNWLWPAEGI
ncbi:aminotransferase [Powellomyces hirtus]|nr:aminotransferase [Powellomyces hirtus]